MQFFFIKDSIDDYLITTTKKYPVGRMDESFFGRKRKANQCRGAAGNIPVFGS